MSAGRSHRAEPGSRGPPRVRPYTPLLVSQRRFGCLFEVVETLVLTFVIFLVIQNFVAQPYRVQQQSMERTLEPDQYVLVDKLTKNFDDYKRGDIVVFNPPGGWAQGDGTPFIKRVIGIENDTVEIQRRARVRERRPARRAVHLRGPGDAGHRSPVVVGDPEDQLFVMGDHRANSADSRVFGPVEKGQVVGRAWLRYWPFSTFGILPTPTHPELQSATP